MSQEDRDGLRSRRSDRPLAGTGHRSSGDRCELVFSITLARSLGLMTVTEGSRRRHSVAFSPSRVVNASRSSYSATRCHLSGSSDSCAVKRRTIDTPKRNAGRVRGQDSVPQLFLPPPDRGNRTVRKVGDPVYAGVHGADGFTGGVSDFAGVHDISWFWTGYGHRRAGPFTRTAGSSSAAAEAQQLFRTDRVRKRPLMIRRCTHEDSLKSARKKVSHYRHP